MAHGAVRQRVYVAKLKFYKTPESLLICRFGDRFYFFACGARHNSERHRALCGDKRDDCTLWLIRTAY